MNRIILPALLTFLFCFSHQADSAESKPNIIYLMLDEWGYFESGHMGTEARKGGKGERDTGISHG